MLKNQKGFSLVELVIVIVVVGILASGAAVHYRDFTGRSKRSTLKASLGAIREGIGC